MSLKTFQVVKQFVKPEICEIVTNYALFQETLFPEKIKSDGLVESTYACYADSLMEAILKTWTASVEKLVNMSLIPTYSYYRVYRSGIDMPEHTDRHACEISLSACFGYNYTGEPWPLIMNNEALEQKPGDIVVYKGIELRHSRPLFTAPENSYQVQGFFHWVDANGEHANLAYDTRPELGLPSFTKRLR